MPRAVRGCCDMSSRLPDTSDICAASWKGCLSHCLEGNAKGRDYGGGETSGAKCCSQSNLISKAVNCSALQDLERALEKTQEIVKKITKIETLFSACVSRAHII